MKRPTVLFVDESPQQRRLFKNSLSELLEGTEYTAEAIHPLANVGEYAKVIIDQSAVALVFDQKMDDGGVQYTGTEMSAQLRSVVPKMPIFILTSHSEDSPLFDDGRADVEEIVAKKSLATPTSPEALIFKARLLRRLDGHTDLLSKRATRFHDLLVKSLRERLAPDEEQELGILNEERILPVQAAELGEVARVDAVLEQLKEFLHPTQLPRQ